MSSPQQRYSQRDELVEIFEQLGRELGDPAEAYLIGGGAMTLRETKDGTKDIDLVTRSRESFRRVCGALTELGYQVQDTVASEYQSLGATAVLKSNEEGHIDIFDRQVALKLTFSEQMAERADELLTHGSLTVHICAPVDIVLFKSMTPRPDDIQDVRTVIATHYGDRFDWATVREEFESQLPLNVNEREYDWVMSDKRHPIHQFERTLRNLEGIPDSLGDVVVKIAEVVEAEGIVVGILRLQGEMDRSSLSNHAANNSPTSETLADQAIDRLAEKGIIELIDRQCVPDWSESI